MGTLYVGKKRYEELKKLGIVFSNQIPDRIKGGVLQFIPEGNFLNNKQNLGVAFRKACEQLKENRNDN